MTKPLLVHCFYCKRTLTPVDQRKGTSFTRDHMRPAEDGGRRTVKCCRACNGLKDNLPLADWFWFIGAFPRWWKTFRGPADVRFVVREEKARRARAGEAPIPDRSRWRP